VKLSYAKAVTLALREAMRDDGNVMCLGEDVGFGGAYGATQTLRDEFGAERVRDTPISETAIVGFSVGAAMQGLRPVAEIMHMDFVTCAMDQIVNQAAKMRYMFGGKASVPIVLRCGVGGYLNAAAQHSQSLEAWFTHVPGLKVLAAGTPRDVRRLLKAAIRDDNPVILLESLALYETTGEVPETDPPYKIGQAEVKRQGDDATVITWGAMVPQVTEAAATLAKQGIEIEVIDLLSLFPWDIETVMKSVWRTNRVVVAHQASTRSGFGAELAAVITERGFDDLDKPVKRVGALNTPVPFAPQLEKYVLPNAERVIDAVKSLL
jgi:acetoin:2,6-dichlorophenolindophenol oxidoreductase subunit beta